MGKHDEVLENTHPGSGCMWGIFHALNYHYWQRNVKKMLPYRKNYVPKHSKGTGRQRTRLNVHDSGEVQMLLDAEASHNIRNTIKPSTRKAISTNKRSLRTRIKALLSEETKKGQSDKRRKSGFPGEPSLQRTLSIHHLETSEYVPSRNAQSDSSVTRLKNRGYEKFYKGGKTHVFESFETEKETNVDVLEIYRVNKDLFVKILEDTEGGVEKGFHNLEASEARTRLTKSGSYPSPKMSQVRKFKSRNLNHKQNEVWSYSQGEKSLARQTVDGSVNDLSRGTPNHIKRTSSINESLEKYAQLFQSISNNEAKLNSSKSLRLTKEDEISSIRHAPISFKRARSLSRLDSFCALQNGPLCDGYLSVAQLKAIAEKSRTVQRDNHDESKPVELLITPDKLVPLEATKGIDHLYEGVERNDSNVKLEHPSNLTESTDEHVMAEILKLGEEMGEQISELRSLNKEKEINSAEISDTELPNSSSGSGVQDDLQEEGNSPADFQASEGFECGNNYTDDKESSVTSETLSPSFSTTENDFQETADEGVEYHLHSELYTRSYDDFGYVSDILDRSGFKGNDLFSPWHSVDQPLNPQMFEEIEACWPHEPQCNKDEFCCHHQLLFDLINEALIQIYDTSFTYYPMALSSNCRVPPMPVKFSILEEVWGRINRTINLKPGLDRTVEGIVAQDMWNDDRWMNLQLDTECVALELEDMIFDELVEEILRS